MKRLPFSRTSSLIVLGVLALLAHVCFAQNLVVNQVSSSLLRATVPNQITVAIDSSYLPTFGYALLTNSTTSNNGNNNGNNGNGIGNSIGNLKDARRMPRQSSSSGVYNGILGNLMMVFQLQHIWELRSNGLDWENFIVGNDTGLSNSISQFALSVNNQTGNIVSINPASVPFTLNSQNNLLTYNGLINRNDLINAYNNAVTFSNNNNNNNNNGDNVQGQVSASTSSSGTNSNANVATSRKQRSVQQSSTVNNGNGLNPVLSLNNVMNQSFITASSLNPATRYIAHCYKASVLDLNNGNEQNAFVMTPQSIQQQQQQQQSSVSGGSNGNAGVGFNTGSGVSVSTNGISLNSGSSASASSSGSSNFNFASNNILGGTNNSMIAFISPLFASSFNEMAYLRVIPQNINMASNPLGGTLVTVQRGNLDTSMVCVIIPRSNASSFVYNMELGFVNSNNIVGAAVNGATSGFSYSYVLLVGLFIALANML